MAADPLTKSTVDDLFNFDLSDFDDDFGDKPALQDTRDDKAVLSPRAGLKRKAGFDKENDDLGLDAEVKIAKKRRPIAKLDEARLLSEPGIPKLRAISRSNQLSKKLRIKGKGHEFTDVARLLNHFQLWLDNLYPRAKFADALQLVEKAGHTKRMHIMRTEWINEGKPGYKSYDPLEKDSEPQAEPDLFGAAPTQSSLDVATGAQSSASGNNSASLFGNGLDDDALFIPDANRPSQLDRDNEPEDDELDALLAAQGTPVRNPPASRQQQTREESEGEDDLDALLAEQDAMYSQPRKPTQPAKPTQAIEAEEEDLDDLDALLAEQEAQTPKPTLQPTTTPKPQPIPSDHSDSEDDLSTLLSLQRRKPTDTDPEPTLPTPVPTSTPPKATPPRTFNPGTMFTSSPIPNNPEDVDLDDLEAMLASQEEHDRAARDGLTPRVRKVREAEMRLFTSSPIPNEESQ